MSQSSTGNEELDEHIKKNYPDRVIIPCNNFGDEEIFVGFLRVQHDYTFSNDLISYYYNVNLKGEYSIKNVSI